MAKIAVQLSHFYKNMNMTQNTALLVYYELSLENTALQSLV